MPSPALRGFVRAFNSPTAPRATVSIALFLAPAADRKGAHSALRAKSARSFGVRQYASVNVPIACSDDTISHPPLGGKSLPFEAEALCRSRKQRDPAAWVSVLELYLPSELRAGPEDSPYRHAKGKSLLSVHSIGALLARARRLSKVDLLSFLGVVQGRWEAVNWLVNAMLEQVSGHSELLLQSAQLPSPLWLSNGKNLNQLTESHIHVEHFQPSNIPLEDLVNQGFTRNHPDNVAAARQSVGQIWQSLGCMILQAEDRSTQDPSYNLIMSHVLQILAHMHHINALPDSMYNYDSAVDPSVLQRPPTLYLMSARIMTVLSDIAWKLHWEEEMENARSYGYELPPARFQPQIRQLGAEIWLDLVLWACVEGGWIKEGAWIVEEMERRKNDSSMRWSVISWDEICAEKTPQLEWTAILKLQIDRSRLNQTTGIGIARSGTSSVEMGKRTVSREVILALMDGFINTSNSAPSAYGTSPDAVQRFILACKGLLGRHNLELDPSLANGVILRILELSALDTKTSPGLLQLLLDIKPRRSDDDEGLTRLGGHEYTDEVDYSAATLGLLHRNLHSFAQMGKVHGSLRSIRHIQDIVDANRYIYIQEFADELRERLRHGNDSVDLIGNGGKKIAPTLYPEIPIYALVTFLDLVTNNQAFDMGNWLLFNDDIDGGIIGSGLYSNRNLQPALLRFATATGDADLLTRILEQLEAPLPEQTLHALLRCQIVLGKWDAIESVLAHFQGTVGMKWIASDVMATAAALLKMGHNDQKTQTRSLSRANDILQGLIQGKYNTPRDQTQMADFTQIRTANQLGRILKTVPGIVVRKTSTPASTESRAHYTTEISSIAFSILLEAVVECHGSGVGKKLWEQWCMNPGDTKPYDGRSALHPHDRCERVVFPTFAMLRIVLRPIIKANWISSSADSEQTGTSASEDRQYQGIAGHTIQDGIHLDVTDQPPERNEEYLILEWGYNMFRKLGLPKKEVNAELRGFRPWP